MELHPPAQRGGRGALIWSLLALGMGLLLSAAIAGYQYRVLAAERDNQFDHLAERSFTALQSTLNTCGLLIRSVQSTFLASDNVTPEEFDRVYQNLNPKQVFPSLQAIAFSARVRTEAGGQDHYITRMLAPSAGNEKLLGLDLVTQPANLRAVQLSADSDQLAMTAAFRLVQLADLPGNPDGIVIRLPTYSPGLPPQTLQERRARLTGSLGVSFRVSSLIETALPRETRHAMDVHVHDMSAPGAPLLFDSLPPEKGELEHPGIIRRHDIVYGGRIWRMELRPRPGYAEVPWLSTVLNFVGGAIASTLLGLLVWTGLRTRVRAVVLAGEMTSRYRESEERFRALNELLPALVLLARADGQLVYANRAARTRLALFPVDEVPQSLPSVLAQPDLLEQASTLDDQTPQLLNQHAELCGVEGKVIWATLSLSRIEIDGQPHLLALANDITELHELTEQLAHQVNHDDLTGLHNRRYFYECVDAAIEAQGKAKFPSALLYLDLDQFKLINDACGHAAGDAYLVHIAARLRTLVRSQDALARLGGDEFGVLMPDASRDKAEELAEILRSRTEEEVFTWDNHPYRVSASIGVVLIEHAGMSRREVLSMADTACYLAKDNGRNRVHFSTSEDAETVHRQTQMEWVNHVRRALAENRFQLDYQELQDLRGGRTDDSVIEVLVRMRMEDGSIVLPGAFIPAAEQFSLMPALDRWVVEAVLGNFDSLHPSGSALTLCAINLSVTTIDDPGFVGFVLDAIARHHVAPEKLCFEITETAVIAGIGRVLGFMQELHRAGCRFALDDVGAGMASFGYLKNLPVDILKIDGSFIRDMQSDPVSRSMVDALTQIGHQLGLEVIAEWVSTERELELLREVGVDYVQGYAVHRPETALPWRGND
jgi:diguanylate cyclase (GGDEF)-like protein/PAS domain S-box-containing protein